MDRTGEDDTCVMLSPLASQGSCAACVRLHCDRLILTFARMYSGPSQPYMSTDVKNSLPSYSMSQCSKRGRKQRQIRCSPSYHSKRRLSTQPLFHKQQATYIEQKILENSHDETRSPFVSFSTHHSEALKAKGRAEAGNERITNLNKIRDRISHSFRNEHSSHNGQHMSEMIAKWGMQSQSRTAIKLREAHDRLRKRFEVWNIRRRDSEQSTFSDHIRIAQRMVHDTHKFSVLRSRTTRHLLVQYRKETAECVKLILESAENCFAKDPTRYERLCARCLQIETLALDHKTEDARLAMDALRKEYLDLFPSGTIMHQQSSFASHRTIKDPQTKLIVNTFAGILESALQQVLFTESESSTSNSDTIIAEILSWTLACMDYRSFLHFTNPAVSVKFSSLVILHGKLEEFIEKFGEYTEKDATSSEEGISLIILSLLNRQETFKAYRITRMVVERGLKIREVAFRKLIMKLSLEGEFALTERSIQILTQFKDTQHSLKLQRNTLRTMAKHYARSGNADDLAITLTEIARHYPDQTTSNVEFAQYAKLCLATINGDVDECIRSLNDKYDMRMAPGSTPGMGLLTPKKEQFYLLLRATLKANRLNEAENLIETMSQFGILIDLSVLNPLFQCYVQRNDLSAALSLFDEIVRSGHQPNKATYTALIKLFACNKDVTSAAAVVASMSKAGLQPDRFVLGTLLDAHIEAGSWAGAIKLFDYMEQSSRPQVQPGTSQYNTMLKAHVQRALPVQQTFKFLNEMLRAGFEPTPITFSLVLQAACDAGLMDLAEDIFDIIEQRLDGKTFGKGANSWHFAIMIQGYVRLGELAVARNYIDEMISRRLPRSDALCNVLVSALTKDEDTYDFEIAREVARSYASDDPNRLLSVYQPLMQVTSKKAQAAVVQSLIEEVIDRGVEIPIHIWTILLDTLRRQENVDGAFEVWNIILEKALHSPTFNPMEGIVVGYTSRSRRNLLTIPLSIIIDALTLDGRFDDIANIWITCRENGFGFDSHNWNHLTVALLHARRLKDACGIIERVLSGEAPTSEWKFRDISVSHTGKDKKDSASIDLDDLLLEVTGTPEDENTHMGATDNDRVREPFRPPNRRHQTRTRDDLFTPVPSELLKNNQSRRNSQSSDQISLEVEESSREMGSQNNEVTEEGGTPFEPPERIESYKEHDAPFSAKRSNGQESLKLLKARELLDSLQSPWFAHFETMQLLNELIQEGHRNGGHIEGSISSASAERYSVNDLLQQHPRVRSLLTAFQEKVESIRERARLSVSRRARDHSSSSSEAT